MNVARYRAACGTFPRLTAARRERLGARFI